LDKISFLNLLDRFLMAGTTAQEKERKSIAMEFHDDSMQALVVHFQQIYDLASSVKRLPKHIIARLEELRQQANTIMQGLRRLSQDLQPLTIDRLGLLPALRHLSADVTECIGHKNATKPVLPKI